MFLKPIWKPITSNTCD